MNNINVNNIFAVSDSNKVLDVHSLYHREKPEIQQATKVTFSVDSLIADREDREKKIVEEYKKIFHKCLKKIKLANKMNKYDIIFEIPTTVFMCPGYNTLCCMNYINSRLQKLYMDTSILTDRTLFITWINIADNKKKSAT
jgi:hypothetical protein